ncbi:MAG: hypothetical protein KF744_12135 [Taibaiella sp.]|nr:hypothetical protein [Taibaiella sp.]
MDKTIHKKLTTKHFPDSQRSLVASANEHISILREEKRIIEDLSSDLLQPRPEVVANILRLAASL